MAMTPYTRTQTGPVTIKNRDGSVQIIPNQLVRSIVLSNVATTVGDYITPNPHRYQKLARSTLYGFEMDTYANGETRVITGPDLRAWNFGILLPTGFDENVRAMALSDLYQTLRDSDIDLSVDGVQWRQTLAMVSNWKAAVFGLGRHIRYVTPVASKTQQALDVLNKGNLHRDRRARLTREVDSGLQWLANRRLEYVYGIKPTLSTIHDLAKLATTPSKKGFVTIYGYGFVQGNKILMQTINGLPMRNDIRHLERCRVVCKFAPADDTLEKLGAISSLNPASLIYEATPYSFVLDWAIGFGSWFRSMETALMHQNNFLGGYQTRSIRWINKGRWSGQTQSSLPNYRADARGEVVFTRFERTRLSSAPFPTRPVVKVRFGLEQASNAASLLKQRVSFIDTLLDFRKRK